MRVRDYLKATSILPTLVGLLVGAIIGGISSTYIHWNDSIHANDPMDMDHIMHSMVGDLQNKTGNDFDQAFLSQMVVHHQGAVEMAQLVLKTSQRPELILLAKDIISTQSKEIDVMQGWQKLWLK